LVRGRWGAVAALLTATLAVAALALGCERRSQDAPAASAPAAALTATAGYGAEVLLDTRVAPGDSLMRALRGATDVDTAYGGGFVAGMLGRRSDAAATLDWFFFVDGVSSPVGAKDVRLRDGDVVWWDHRDWGALIDTPAVVGAWPRPLTRVAGRTPPVHADPPLRDALAAAGADVVDGDTPWRAVVGASDDLAAREPAWARALDDPDGAGLTVAIEDGRVTALAADGGPREPVPGARALVAAIPTGTDPADGVTVVVAGLDAAAARAAADTVAADPAVLLHRYAVAFDGTGRPLRAGGRSGP
jgi:hypothetical protein